jgi:hypothetical protein
MLVEHASKMGLKNILLRGVHSCRSFSVAFSLSHQNKEYHLYPTIHYHRFVSVREYITTFDLIISILFSPFRTFRYLLLIL